MKVQFLLALRYLNGRKLRSFLTTLAVLFGVMVIFGMNILIPSMMQSFQATMLAASNNVDLTISLRSGESFPETALDTLRGVEGVRTAQGVLSRPVNLPADFYDHDPPSPTGSARCRWWAWICPRPRRCTTTPSSPGASCSPATRLPV